MLDLLERDAIVTRPSRVGFSFPLPQDEIRPSFRNVVLSGYLEFRTMYKIHKPSDSKIMEFKPTN
jgi:hypothetical protein